MLPRVFPLQDVHPDTGSSPIQPLEHPWLRRLLSLPARCSGVGTHPCPCQLLLPLGVTGVPSPCSSVVMDFPIQPWPGGNELDTCGKPTREISHPRENLLLLPSWMEGPWPGMEGQHPGMEGQCPGMEGQRPGTVVHHPGSVVHYPRMVAHHPWTSQSLIPGHQVQPGPDHPCGHPSTAPLPLPDPS